MTAPTDPEPRWDLTSVLAYAWAAVAVHGWTPAHADGHGIPTRDLVATLMRGGQDAKPLLRGMEAELTHGADLAPSIINKLTQAFTEPDGYQANLRAILTAGVVNPAKDLGLAVSAIPAFLRLLEQELADLKAGRGRTLEFVGEPGQNVTVTGTVTSSMLVNGFTEPSPFSRTLIIDCGNAIAKTVTAAAWANEIQVGDRLTIAGTVKRHEQWRNLPQTVIGRPRRIDDPPGSPTPDHPGIVADRSPTLWPPIVQAGPRRRFPEPPDAPTPRPRLTP